MLEQKTIMPVNRFYTRGEDNIFQIQLEAFPNLIGFAYIVITKRNEDEKGSKNYRVLIDPGSGFGLSNQQLETSLKEISELLGEEIGFSSLTHIFITHAHIDHFGSLSYIRPKTKAQIGIHELDLRNLVNYEERIAIATQRLRNYLKEAGVPESHLNQLISLYRSMKYLYKSIAVDFTYERIGMQLGPFEFFHLPGHSAGHVVIRLGDVLFCGDHILSHITPHQSPERLTLSTGLEHYLSSLNKLRDWVGEVRLVLPGHESIITNLNERIDEIQFAHRERLEKILKILKKPKTVYELSIELFREVKGYDVLLAIEEAGAHVEYLYQRGYLKIENLEEEEKASKMAPIKYRSVPCQGCLISERR